MLKQVCGTCGNEWKITKTVNVELKETPDFWASKSTGHLGQQILEMIVQGQPGFVAVFGSLQEVLAECPKMQTEKASLARSQMDIVRICPLPGLLRRCERMRRAGIFPDSTNHQQSFPWILSLAKNLLTGPTSRHGYRRFDVDARSYGILCSIPGVGDAVQRTAEGLWRRGSKS